MRQHHAHVLADSRGNPNISHKRLAAGVVYQPHFLEELSVSADYYLINTKDLIRDIDAVNITNACVNGDGNQCNNVIREPDDGAG